MKIEIETNLGTIVLELYPDKAPKTVANFMGYVHAGFYNGLIFHRVINRFMIQAGAFNARMVKATGVRPTIENEANNGLKNDKYTIAMARTNAPHSADSQFFISTQDNSFLNYRNQTPAGWGYTVFGVVVEGTDE